MNLSNINSLVWSSILIIVILCQNDDRENIMAVKIEDIVTRDVTDEQILEAKKIRAERDEKYGNIYAEEDTDMRWVGDLGEIVINELFCMCKPEATQWHLDDVTGRADFNFCQIELDVKTVKRQVPIKPYYKAQITAKHAKTPMDYLVFTCYEFPVKKLHVLGAMKKTDFLAAAEYFGEGDSVHSNYTIRKGHEIYNITISELTPFREFIHQAMKEKGLTKAA